jgi:hypothetical protein
MKNITLLSTFCFLLFSLVVHAQTPPNAFNYSAVARNAAGQPIATTTIGIQISILKSSATGAVQYSENHFVNTDAFGLFNLVIGTGAVQSGSMATIIWSNDNYYLKVGMDASGGTNFLTMGTTQLLSVPYAMHAKTAENGIDRISGDTLYLSNGQSFVSSASGGGAGNLVLPTITTNAVTGITSNSATYSGTISNANGNQIMERGFVYSTSPNPTILSNKIVIGSGTGVFDTIISLTPDGIFGINPHLLNSNTTYYIRAYAVTENNISSYGNEVVFTTLSVGQTGPGGGLVFFDKGNSNGGWRYLEAASSDQSTGISWGCSGTSISGTLCDVGRGENNTALIVAGCNDVSFAAKLCDNLILGGQSDWFLPSAFELYLMMKNLYLNGQGNFITFSQYSSSSETTYSPYNLNHIFTVSLDVNQVNVIQNGAGNPGSSKNIPYKVRAIRSY